MTDKYVYEPTEADTEAQEREIARNYKPWEVNAILNSPEQFNRLSPAKRAGLLENVLSDAFSERDANPPHYSDNSPLIQNVKSHDGQKSNTRSDWRREKKDVIQIQLDRGTRQYWKDAADRFDLSLSEMIRQAVTAYINVKQSIT